MADKTQINLERIRACDAEWNESKHPREDNGRFTSGSGAHVSKLRSGGKAKASSIKAGEIAKNQERYDNAHKSMAANYLSDLTNAIKGGDYETAREKLERHEKDKKRYDQLTAQNNTFKAAKAALEKARPKIEAARKFAKTQSAAASGQKMDDLTKKYMQQGKNDHAMVAMMLKSEMAMADGDFYKAVGALQRKFDDPELGFGEDRQKKLSDILLNDVSGDAFDVVKPEKAPAAKPAAAPAAKPAKAAGSTPDAKKPLVSTKAGGVLSVTGGGNRGQLHVVRKGAKQYVWLQSTKKDGSFGKPIAYEVRTSPEETLKRMQENNPGSKWRFSETEGKHFAS